MEPGTGRERNPQVKRVIPPVRAGRSVLAVAFLATALAGAAAAEPTAQATAPPSERPDEAAAAPEGSRAPAVTPEVAPAYDPGAPPRTTIRIAPFLTFGGRASIEYEIEENFDLRNERDDRLSTLEPELSLALSFEPGRYVRTYLNVVLAKEYTLEEEDESTDRPTRLEIRDAFLSLREPIERLALHLGRQRFRDDREWLYDERLDAVRAVYRLGDLSIDLSVSREQFLDRDLLNEESRDRIINYMLYARYPLGRRAEVAAYGIARRDRAARDRSPIFFGLHSSGEFVRDLEHWLELAWVRGDDGPTRLRGVGFDLGAAYQFRVPLRPSIALGYAFGSGDDDAGDGVDTSFRQTGLEENEARFHGVTRFKYYGELLDPELSNLSILTAGIGIRPARRSSLDLVYHSYLQVEPARRFRDVDVDRNPTGRSRDVGDEIDLIAGFRGLGPLDLKLVLGYFVPGDAFPENSDPAVFGSVKVQYNF